MQNNWGQLGNAEVHGCTFFFLPLPSLPAVSRDSWTEMKARPLQSSSSTLSLSLANLHSCLSDICTGPPLCLLSGEWPNISSPTPKKAKEKTLRCIDRAAGKHTLWPRYERVCGLVIKGKQGPPRGLAEFREASQWAARKRIGFRGEGHWLQHQTCFAQPKAVAAVNKYWCGNGHWSNPMRGKATTTETLIWIWFKMQTLLAVKGGNIDAGSPCVNICRLVFPQTRKFPPVAFCAWGSA